MASKRNKLLIFLGFLIFATAKSQNQNLLSDALEFESQRTSATRLSAINQDTDHRDSEHLVKGLLDSSSKSATVYRGYLSAFESDDTSHKNLEHVPEITRRMFHESSNADQSSLRSQQENTQTEDSDYDSSDSSIELHPAELHYDSRRVKTRPKPRKVRMSRRKGSLTENINSEDTQKSTDHGKSLAENDSSQNQKNKEVKTVKKDDSEKQQKEKGPQSKTKIKRKRLKKVKLILQKNNPTKNQTNSESVSSRHATAVTEMTEQITNSSAIDKILEEAGISTDGTPKLETISGSTEPKTRHSNSGMEDKTDIQSKSRSTERKARKRTKIRTKHNPEIETSSRIIEPQTSKRTKSRTEASIEKEMTSSTDSPELPTYEPRRANVTEGSYKNIETNTENTPSSIKKQMYRDADATKSAVPTSPKNEKKDREDYLISFFRRIGEKLSQDQKPAKTYAEPEWVSKYLNEERSTDDHYVVSFNYMGDRNSQEKDFVKLSQRSSPRKGPLKKSFDIPKKKITSKKLEPYHLPDFHAEQLDSLRQLSDDRPVDYKQPEIVKELQRDEPEPIPLTEKIVSNENWNEDVYPEGISSLSIDDTPPTHQRPTVVIKRKPGLKYKEPVWTLENSQKKGEMDEEWKKIPLDKFHRERNHYKKDKLEIEQQKGDLSDNGDNSYFTSGFVNQNSKVQVVSPYVEREGPIGKSGFSDSSIFIDGDSREKITYPTEEQGSGKYFLHMYNRRGDVDLKNVDAKSGEISEGTGYISEMKLLWDDDATNARVETAFNAQSSFPQTVIPYSHEDMYSAEDASGEIYAPEESETHQPEESENILQRKFAYDNDFVSPLNVEKPYFQENVPINVRRKRSANAKSPYFVQSHFKIGETNVRTNYAPSNENSNINYFNRRQGVVMPMAIESRSPNQQYHGNGDNSKTVVHVMPAGIQPRIPNGQHESKIQNPVVGRIRPVPVYPRNPLEQNNRNTPAVGRVVPLFAQSRIPTYQQELVSAMPGGISYVIPIRSKNIPTQTNIPNQPRQVNGPRVLKHEDQNFNRKFKSLQLKPPRAVDAKSTTPESQGKANLTSPFSKYQKPARNVKNFLIFHSYQSPKRETNTKTSNAGTTAEKKVKSAFNKSRVKTLYQTKINTDKQKKPFIPKYRISDNAPIVQSSTDVSSSFVKYDNDKADNEEEIFHHESKETKNSNQERMRLSKDIKESRSAVSGMNTGKDLENGDGRIFKSNILFRKRGDVNSKSQKSTTSAPSNKNASRHNDKGWVLREKEALQQAVRQHLIDHAQNEKPTPKVDLKDELIISNSEQEGNYAEDIVDSNSLAFGNNIWDNGFILPQSEEPNYPTFHSIPKTHFTCKGKSAGYYADPETGCQVFHMCQGTGAKHSFLCPNTTVFNQLLLVCDWHSKVNCGKSESLYDINNHIYRDKWTLHKSKPGYEEQPGELSQEESSHEYPVKPSKDPRFLPGVLNKKHLQNKDQLRNNHKHVHASHSKKEVAPTIKNQKGFDYYKEDEYIVLQDKDLPEKSYKPLGAKSNFYEDEGRATKNSWNPTELRKSIQYELITTPENNDPDSQDNLSTGSDLSESTESRDIDLPWKEKNIFQKTTLPDIRSVITESPFIQVSKSHLPEVTIPDHDYLQGVHNPKNSVPGFEITQRDKATIYHTKNTEGRSGNEKLREKLNINDDPRIPRYIYPLPGIVQNEDGSKEFNYGFRVEDPGKVTVHSVPIFKLEGSKEKFVTENNKDKQKTLPITKIKWRIAEIKSGIGNLGADVGKILETNGNTYKNIQIYKLNPKVPTKDLHEIRLKPFKFQRHPQSQLNVHEKIKNTQAKAQNLGKDLLQRNPSTNVYASRNGQQVYYSDGKTGTKGLSNNAAQKHDENTSPRIRVKSAGSLRHVGNSILLKDGQIKDPQKAYEDEKEKSWTRYRTPLQDGRQLNGYTIQIGPLSKINVNPRDFTKTSGQLKFASGASKINLNDNINGRNRSQNSFVSKKLQGSTKYIYVPQKEFIGDEFSSSEERSSLNLPRASLELPHIGGERYINPPVFYKSRTNDDGKSQQIPTIKKHELHYWDGKTFPSRDDVIKHALYTHSAMQEPRGFVITKESGPNTSKISTNTQGVATKFLHKQRPVETRHRSNQGIVLKQRLNIRPNLKSKEVVKDLRHEQTDSSKECKEFSDRSQNTLYLSDFELGKNGPKEEPVKKRITNSEVPITPVTYTGGRNVLSNINVHYVPQSRSRSGCKGNGISKVKRPAFEEYKAERQRFLDALTKPTFLNKPIPEVARNKKEQQYVLEVPEKAPARNKTSNTVVRNKAQIPRKPIKLFNAQRTSHPAVINHDTKQNAKIYLLQPPSKVFHSVPINQKSSEESKSIEDSKSNERSKRVANKNRSRFTDLEKAAELKTQPMKSHSTTKRTKGNKVPALESYAVKKNLTHKETGKPSDKLKETSNEKSESESVDNNLSSRYAALEKAVELEAERMIRSAKGRT